MNYIFISPNFPDNYWHFCRELRMNGFRVLGIGDQSYDELSGELRQALHEYYKVSSLENYDEVYRAGGGAPWRARCGYSPARGLQACCSW